MQTPPLKKPNQTRRVAAIIGLIFIVWYFAYGRDMFVHKEMDRITNEVPARMQQINNQVADDAVQKYEIVSRQGDKMQMYTQASLCAAAFLQAKDEANYVKWQGITDDLGKQLGLRTDNK